MPGSIQSPTQQPTSYGYNFSSDSNLSTSEQSTTENTYSSLLDQTVCVPENKTESYIPTNLQSLEIDQLFFSDRHVKEINIDSYLSKGNNCFQDTRVSASSDDNPEYGDNFLDNLANSTTNSSPHLQNTGLFPQSDDNSEELDGDWAYCYDFCKWENVSDEDIEAVKSEETAKSLKRSFDYNSEEQQSTSKKPKIVTTTPLISIQTIAQTPKDIQTIQNKIHTHKTTGTIKKALPHIHSYTDCQNIYKKLITLHDDNILEITNKLFTTNTPITVRDVFNKKIDSFITKNTINLNDISIEDIFGYTLKEEIIYYYRHNTIQAIEEIPHYLNMIMTAIYCNKKYMSSIKCEEILLNKFGIDKIQIKALMRHINYVLNMNILQLFLLHHYFIVGGTVFLLNSLDTSRFPLHHIHMLTIQGIACLLAGYEKNFPDPYCDFFETLNQEYTNLIKEPLQNLTPLKRKGIFVDTNNKEKIHIEELHELKDKVCKKKKL